MKKIIFTLIISALLSVSALAGVFDMQLRADSSQRFTDVSAEDSFKTAIDGVLTYGIMNGVSEDRFEPFGNTTRGALVTILWRMSGSPHSEAETPFTDLAQDWYADAVRWSYETGIVNGTGADTFSPDLPVSRETLTTVFFRYLRSLDTNAQSHPLSEELVDRAEVSQWAEESAGWASEMNIIDVADGKLRPKETATRAEIASVIMSFCSEYRTLFPAVDDPDEDGEYKNIIKQLATSYEYTSLGESNTQGAVYFRHPAQWEFVKREDGGFDLTRDGRLIGEVIFGKKEDSWKVISSRSIDGRLDVNEYIEKYGGGLTLTFRYRYEYLFRENGEEKAITLTVDCAQVSSVCAKRLFSEPILQSVSTSENYGILSELNGKKILIAGNSFINTSKIGYTLSDIVSSSGNKLSVFHWSTGYAHVDTYLNNNEFMTSVRNGSYDAVFICGLYSSDQVEPLGKLKQECEKAGVMLIVLPAYNEDAAAIKMARDEYPDLPFLDWKGEVTALIDSGVSKWELCVNDAHLHSTPLAGYVGAHMIYRAIFGECPKGYPSRYLTKSEVETKLGSYITSPVIRLIDEEQIKYLN